MRITSVKALASRLVAGMAEMKPVVRSKALEKHTASLIFLHGSGEFQPLNCHSVHIEIMALL